MTMSETGVRKYFAQLCTDVKNPFCSSAHPLTKAKLSTEVAKKREGEGRNVTLRGGSRGPEIIPAPRVEHFPLGPSS